MNSKPRQPAVSPAAYRQDDERRRDEARLVAMQNQIDELRQAMREMFNRQGREEELLKHDLKTVRREGDRENRWVLLDFLDTVVHVQHSEERALYALERLWKDCPRLDLGDLEPPAQA